MPADVAHEDAVLKARQRLNEKKCKYCDGCEKCESCDHCGHCRVCGKPISKPSDTDWLWYIPEWTNFRPVLSATDHLPFLSGRDQPVERAVDDNMLSAEKITWITEPKWLPPPPPPKRGWPVPVQHYVDPQPPLGMIKPLYFIEER